MRLGVITQSRHSRSRDASDRPDLLSSRRLCQEKAGLVHAVVPTTLGLLVEPLDHLPPVADLRPLPAPVAAVQWNDRGPHPEALLAVPVVLLAAERRVGEQPVPGDDPGRLGQDLAALEGVAGRTDGDGRHGEEVARLVRDEGEFGLEPGGVVLAGPLEEVAGERGGGGSPAPSRRPPRSAANVLVHSRRQRSPPFQQPPLGVARVEWSGAFFCPTPSCKPAKSARAATTPR